MTDFQKYFHVDTNQINQWLTNKWKVSGEVKKKMLWLLLPKEPFCCQASQIIIKKPHHFIYIFII